MIILNAAIVMLVRVVLGATMVITLLTNTALAFDPIDLKKLEKTNECAGCDLSGSDLSDVRLIDANIRCTNLEGANLQRADL